MTHSACSDPSVFIGLLAVHITTASLWNRDLVDNRCKMQRERLRRDVIHVVGRNNVRAGLARDIRCLSAHQQHFHSS